MYSHDITLFSFQEKVTTFNRIWHPICQQSRYQLIVVKWRHVASENLVNIALGKGVLPDGAKPLPETNVTYHD